MNVPHVLPGAQVFAHQMPALQQITTSHSLALIKAASSRQYGANVQALCTPTSKNTFYLEHYRGAFFRYRYDPRSTLTVGGILMMQSGPPMNDMGFMGADEFIENDFIYVIDRFYKGSDFESVQSRENIISVIKAISICRKPNTVQTIKHTISICPKYCPLPYIILFHLEAGKYFGLMENNPMEKVLRSGVAAGRELVSLLKANEFCKGNLYNYEPTRNYIRALYLCGSFLLAIGNPEEAFDLFQECLVNDLHDKLGARHKQLLSILDFTSKKGKFDKRVADLLKAKFGEDQYIDDLLALWNYTRALYTFHTKGICKKSKRLLVHAIDANPYVPPLLLRWDSSKSIGTHKLMEIGKEGEAVDFYQDNRKYWDQVDGALDWLADVYVDHKKAMLPNVNRKGLRLLTKGNRLLETEDPTKAESAIEKFEKLLTIGESDHAGSTTSLISMQRLGSCYRILGDIDKAIGYFQTALSTDTAILEANRDIYKELLYGLAICMEKIGYDEGALKVYNIIFTKIGAFSTAYERVKQIESKMGAKSGVIPECLDQKGPTPDCEKLHRDMRVGCDALLQQLMESGSRGSSIASSIERCYHCKRGGVKLSLCSSCSDKEVLYCSRACQVSSWKQVHKYTCIGSKHKIGLGCTVSLKGLEAKPQLNGKIASVARFSNKKGRFIVTLVENGSQILVRPQNLDVQSSS